MKEFLLVILLAAFNCIPAISQSCIPDSILFNTQESVDRFHLDYPGCSEIEGNVKITGIDITNLNGLDMLTSVGGDLSIGNNYNMISLDGLNSLAYVGGNLNIHDSYTLVDISGLESLGQVGGNFTMHLINHLESLHGLENLQSVEGDFIMENLFDLRSLDGLANLSSVGGDFRIQKADSLYSSAGMQNLDTIGGNIWILGNDNLTDLGFLQSWTSFDGGIWISNNDNLQGLYGLENITYVSDYVTIYKNKTLKNLLALSNLSQIGGSLAIGMGDIPGLGNDSLVDLSGLENLNSVGGSLHIIENNQLVDLTALAGLKNIGGDLEIKMNISLPSLSGLDNIAPLSIQGLIITDNRWLSTCDVESICAYLADPTDTVAISGNDDGCASREQVESLCGVGMDENYLQDNFYLGPNPFKDQASINFLLLKSSYVELVISNLLGQECKVLYNGILEKGKHQFIINGNDLVAGIYVCKFNAGNHGFSAKLVKMK